MYCGIVNSVTQGIAEISLLNGGMVCDPDDGSGDWYYFDTTVDGPLAGACWRSCDNGAMEIWYVDQADKI